MRSLSDYLFSGISTRTTSVTEVTIVSFGIPLVAIDGSPVDGGRVDVTVNHSAISYHLVDFSRGGFASDWLVSPGLVGLATTSLVGISDDASDLDNCIHLTVGHLRLVITYQMVYEVTSPGVLEIGVVLPSRCISSEGAIRVSVVYVSLVFAVHQIGSTNRSGGQTATEL